MAMHKLFSFFLKICFLGEQSQIQNFWPPDGLSSAKSYSTSIISDIISIE